MSTSRSSRWGALLALSGVVLLPALVLAALLYASEQAAYTVFATRAAGLFGLSVLLSLGLGLAPLAVWPMRTRTYAALAAAFLAPLFALNVVHVVEYRELISLGAIDAIVSTTWHEAREFATARLSAVVTAVVGAFVLGGVFRGLVRRVPKSHRVSPLQRGAAALGGVLALATLVGMQDPPRVFPLSTLKNSLDFMQQRQAYQVLRAERAHFRFEAVAVDSLRDAPETIVVVIGESVRREQLPMYGYPRNTMPRTGNRGWLVFDDVVSAASQTQYSVKAMLTSARPETVARHAEKSVLTLAREIGVETHWISNQDRTFDTEVALIAAEADHTVYTNHSWSAGRRYDEALLPHLAQALSRPAPRKLIVLHMAGSHEMYSRRYPPVHAYFSRGGGDRPPLQLGLSASEQATIDQYDDSIRYTDFVLNEVLDQVEASPGRAAVLYLSDHGEHLYDTPERLIGHGMPDIALVEVRVPLLAWATPDFRQERARTWAALSANRRAPMTSADLFFALSDLLGARYRGHRPDRSIASAAYTPAPRSLLTVHGTVEPCACDGSVPVAERRP